MSKETPSKLSTTHFLSFSPIIYFCQNSVGVVIAWEWEEYGEKIELGRAPILEKRVLTSWEKKHPKTYAHSLRHSRFHFFPHVLGEKQNIFLSPILHSRRSLMHMKFHVFYPSYFQLFSSLCMSMKSILGAME